MFINPKMKKGLLIRKFVNPKKKKRALIHVIRKQD